MQLVVRVVVRRLCVVAHLGSLRGELLYELVCQSLSRSVSRSVTAQAVAVRTLSVWTLSVWILCVCVDSVCVDSVCVYAVCVNPVCVDSVCVDAAFQTGRSYRQTAVTDGHSTHTALRDRHAFQTDSSYSQSHSRSVSQLLSTGWAQGFAQPTRHKQPGQLKNIARLERHNIPARLSTRISVWHNFVAGCVYFI